MPSALSCGCETPGALTADHSRSCVAWLPAESNGFRQLHRVPGTATVLGKGDSSSPAQGMHSHTCRQVHVKPVVSAMLYLRVLSARFADLAPTYEAVCTEMDWPLDSAKLEAMRAANAAKLEVGLVRTLSVSTSRNRDLVCAGKAIKRHPPQRSLILV